MALYLSSVPLAEFVTHIYPKLSFKQQADGAVLKLQWISHKIKEFEENSTSALRVAYHSDITLKTENH